MMKLLTVLVLACSLSAWGAPQPGQGNPTVAAKDDAFAANMRKQQNVMPLMATIDLRRGGSGSTAGASASASASAAGASGSGATTPAPTAAPGSTRIVQVATVDTAVVANAAAYTGAVKTLFERAYGKMIGICANTACSSYKAGGDVTSQASDTAFRRGNVYVQFTATVAPADAAAAQTAATAFTTTAGQTTFVTGMTEIKNADTATFGSVTVPTAAQVTGLAPTVTTVGGSGNGTTTGGAGGSTSGSEQKSVAGWCLAMALGVLALRQ